MSPKVSSGAKVKKPVVKGAVKGAAKLADKGAVRGAAKFAGGRGAGKVAVKGSAKAPGSRARARRRSDGRSRRGAKKGSAAATALESQARVYVAIDETSIPRVAHLQSQLLPYVGGFSLGPSFLIGHGPDLVREIFGEVPLLLDLKLHDIPNMVERSVRRLFRYHPHVITVHASGGYDMLKAAASAAQDHAVMTGIPRPSVIATTVLTSLSAEDLSATGVKSEVRDQVLRLGELAWRAGLDGVMAAPRDVGALREKFGRRLMLFTSGLRSRTGSADDHKRTTTPAEALSAGAAVFVFAPPRREGSAPAPAPRSPFCSLGYTRGGR
ncbi:MAG: orotidine 5'-phosphate decarboxylase, partial [Alphaproteobacteria bacterium]|nr:orotidine 5'-phosphate decarboxylase [Alphaproteobacteria bacterium]